MKHTWIAYVLTGLVAAGAGVAIAGLPSEVPDDVVIDQLPSTTSTTVAPITVPVPVTTGAPVESSVATTTTTTTLFESTTTSTSVTLADPADMVVGVANATDQSGLAAETVARLALLGYAQAAPIDATAPAPVTTVYYADGLEAEAARLAVDAGLDETAIAPIIEAPAVSSTALFQLLLVIGLDQV